MGREALTDQRIALLVGDAAKELIAREGYDPGFWSAPAQARHSKEKDSGCSSRWKSCPIQGRRQNYGGCEQETTRGGLVFERA